MPYSANQNRVFRAIAHGWKPKKGSLKSISQSEASKMASEGIRKHASAVRRYRRRRSAQMASEDPRGIARGKK